MSVRTPGSALAAVLLAGIAVAAHAAEPLRSAFDLQIPTAPTVVPVAGKPLLVYELHLTNFAREALTLKRVSILDAESGALIADLRGEALEQRLGRPGLGTPDTSRRTIGPGLRAVLYLELTPEGGGIPDALSHRVEYEVAGSMSRESAVVDGTHIRVQREPLPVLGPPLHGGPWVAIYGPAWERGHRRVMYAVDGRVRIPGRFAIDWIRLDADARKVRGDEDRVIDWLGYGADVLAVADALVAATRDDVAESERLSAHVSPALQDATGNFVALELSAGRYAFYEHLKPGSIRVARGERVRRGQVIAGLGFTGQSTGPHLHFHIADANSPLGAEGVPYVLEGFKLLGRFESLEELGSMPWLPLGGGGEPQRRGELPAPNAVVVFPGPSGER